MRSNVTRGWFDHETNLDAPPTGRRGRQQTYSDTAKTRLTMKVLFGMALRQTTGFVESLLRLTGLDWTVPNFSTLSRRQKSLRGMSWCRVTSYPRCPRWTARRPPPTRRAARLPRGQDGAAGGG